MKTYPTIDGMFITECRYGGRLLICEAEDRHESRDGCLELIYRRVKSI